MARDFEWAEPYPEVHKMCVLFRRDELRAPLKWHYRSLPVCLQRGPQCGLVALAMLSQAPCEYTVDIIFQHAQEMGFSCHGEVFSWSYMLAMAKHFLGKDSCEPYSGRLDDKEIKRFLLEGGCLLVPYDTDKDNSPGLHRGHKAHWCAISGAIDTGEDFFVIARHGKTRNVGIWRLTDLANSNQQLLEFSPERNLEHMNWQLPEGGIGGPLGLNGKSVLVFNSSVTS